MPETLAPEDTSPAWEAAWQSAMAAVSDGRYEAALESLQTAASAAEPFEDSDARKADTLYLLGATLARFERVEQADPVLSRALALRTEAFGLCHPLVAGTLYVMGEMYRHSHRLYEAQHALVVASEIMEQLDLNDELTSDIEMSASLVLKQTGQPGESLKHATKAARLLPPDSPWRPALLELAASLDIAHGAYELAADIFARISATQEPGPELNATLGALADMQLVQDQWEEALATVQRALEAEPQDVALLRRKAVALSRLGRYDESEAALLTARDISFLNQKKAELTKLMAEVNLRAQRWEQAATRFEETLPLIQRNPLLRAQVRLALGKVYLKLNRQQEAGRQLACAASARRRMRRPPLVLVSEALQLIGSIHNGAGRPGRAFRRLSQALSLMESDLIPVPGMTDQEQSQARELMLAILQELSISLELLGRFKAAAGVLESVVTERQASAFTAPAELAELLDRLALLQEKAGKTKRSIKTAERARLVRESNLTDESGHDLNR